MANLALRPDHAWGTPYTNALEWLNEAGPPQIIDKLIFQYRDGTGLMALKQGLFLLKRVNATS